MKQILLYIAVSLFFPLSAFAQLDDEFHGRQNATINFYGKVVDQDGNPLEGAKINIDIIVGEWRVVPENSSQTFVGTRIDKLTVQSGSDGAFHLLDFTGHGIEIKSVKKDGYRLSLKAVRSYAYSATAEPFHPDANNPVVFRMWKSQGKLPLAGSAWKGNVSCDGTTNRFDMLHGKRNDNGSLQILCMRAPLNIIPREGHRFRYSLEISVIGGGIVTTSDEFTYVAPESGYQSITTIEHKPTDTDWKGDISQEFYIKTAEGNYGRLSVNWYAWQENPTHLDWNCSINPSGSRNLER
jgi:hypothetical protein